MTIREKLEKLLHDQYVLFPAQAKEVLDRVVKADTEMNERWNDRADSYPLTLFAVLMMIVQTEAVKYLEETCPGHFMLPTLKGQL